MIGAKAQRSATVAGRAAQRVRDGARAVPLWVACAAVAAEHSLEVGERICVCSSDPWRRREWSGVVSR